MKKLLAVLVVVLVALVAFAIVDTISESDESPLSGIVNSSVNAAIESSGIKDKVEDALYENADVISKKTGLPASEVRKKIDELDISSWKATTLPSGAKEKGTDAIDYKGAPATITTYDDPSIVTVNSNGVAVTFEVPPSAQSSLDYLKYLE